MDVARLNLSPRRVRRPREAVYLQVRKASDESKRGVAVLVDLQGPKIRLGVVRRPGRSRSANGAEFTITTEDVPGDVHEVGTTYDGLPGDVQPGDRLLIDDGKVALECVAGRRARGSSRRSSRAAGCPTTRASTCPASRSACRRCPRRTSRTCAGRCTCRPT